ncbi:alpha-mannosidase 2-like isoform X2 [Clytia hemisphaerica]|uniref:alpha-mannosidase 2-like isoform X2 n=1 Tax=Clytia hemisphaerica TaxID=252671 RepID=UPI0034D39BFA
MKKLTAIFGSCLFFFVVMTMYLLLDQFQITIDKQKFIEETQNVEKSVNDIGRDINKLEEEINSNDRIIDSMKDRVQVKDNEGAAPDFGGNSEPSEGMCSFTNTPSGDKQDIRMLDFFDEIPFDDIDGGVWKQGWDISYSRNAFDNKKLKVFVMPHSHNDPGWLKTVVSYFNDQTVHIISNIVDALAKDEKRKFIWAETSYFKMWWDQTSPMRRQLAQEQIRNGQLEIVTGGWVMNDESNPHYWNMLDQMMEGHIWMQQHIGVKPKYGWAIDPFGYSSTMPYLLKRMGFEGMLIQRVHYNVKKYLAKKKNLEFMWRQNWDHGKSTDIFTHVMPFYSYDVPHTCGPNPKVCCQFDFRRLSGGGMFCPWHIPPKRIDDHNVRERAETLLDQYKKKAQLYRSNVVLAPLGDDFRYDKEFEVREQFSNYEKLMNYVNSHPELNAEIKFGTLQDYFHAVFEREGVKPGDHPPGFPTLGGDFFTYADRNDHYWSGYYTSRSFFKHMDRELMAHLRAAEIIFSLANAHSQHHGNFEGEDLFHKLSGARKELALFQHHDGVTGTAKDHVVTDYGSRMHRAIKDSVAVMAKSANFLLTTDKNQFKDSSEGVQFFKFSETRGNFDSIPTKNTFIVSNSKTSVCFYNSLAQDRRQTVFLHISEPIVQVTTPDGKVIPHQVSLLWKDSDNLISSKYLLSFVADIPALGLARYEIKKDDSGQESFATTTTYNTRRSYENRHITVKSGSGKEIKLKNHHFEATFDVESGLLTDMKLKDRPLHKMQIKFKKYGTTGRMDKSGAYLFMPDGQATTLNSLNQPVIVTEGKIFSEVRVKTEYVLQIVRVYHGQVDEAKSLKIENILDIRQTSNFELVMRIESDLKNKEKEFFTDLNGFQIQRRKTLAKLPLQANFYPAPALVFLQDGTSRLTLQTQQSNGVASLETGYLEVVMDRRLMQDDNRGLGQGVRDNKVTPSFFNLLLEDFDTPKQQVAKPPPVAYQSSLGITLSHQIQHPIFTFFIASTVSGQQYLPLARGLKIQLPCDTHLLNLKTLPKNIKDEPGDVSTLLLHRIGYDCHFKSHCSERRQTFQDVFDPLTVNDLKETTLSLLHLKKDMNPQTRIDVPPMEIKAFKLKLK